LADNFLEQFGDTQPHQFFLEYMENTWIGRHRRNPLFPKEMWNAKDITEFQLPRTTNSIESWHKILQNTFGCLHPNFFRFMDGILNENLRANAICVKLDASEEVLNKFYVFLIFTKNRCQFIRELNICNQINDFLI